jgi:hypothetical protein
MNFSEEPEASVVEETGIELTDAEPSAIRLAALEQAVIFASNHYPTATKSAHQVVQDAKTFETYIYG